LAKNPTNNEEKTKKIKTTIKNTVRKNVNHTSKTTQRTHPRCAKTPQKTKPKAPKRKKKNSGQSGASRQLSRPEHTKNNPLATVLSFHSPQVHSGFSTPKGEL